MHDRACCTFDEHPFLPRPQFARLGVKIENHMFYILEGLYHRFDFENRQQNRIQRSNIIEWITEIKHNTHKTQSGEWRQKKEDTHKRHPSTIHSLFLFTFTDNWIREIGAAPLSESLKSNTTLTELNLSCENKRKKTHKRHQSSIYPFSFLSHQQTTGLKTEVQHHLVKHWNQTQHSKNLIWVVKTKERRHTKDIHQ